VDILLEFGLNSIHDIAAAHSTCFEPLEALRLLHHRAWTEVGGPNRMTHEIFMNSASLGRARIVRRRLTTIGSAAVQAQRDDRAPTALSGC